MSGDATMSVETQRKDLAVRAALNGIAQPPPIDELYDYTLARGSVSGTPGEPLAAQPVIVRRTVD